MIKIAIDGPAGAGKSTVARMVAEKLGYTYLDTGAMYRAIALAVLQANISEHDAEAIAELIKKCKLEIKLDDQGKNLIYLNGKNVTTEIRNPSVTKIVSGVANHLAVRKMLVEKQREMANSGGVVLDGRDIGTVVLPDAKLKIYLTASLAVRAERRHRELEQVHNKMTLETLITDINERDQKDANNLYGPMRPAEDAIHIDTDKMTINEVVNRIVELAHSVSN